MIGENAVQLRKEREFGRRKGEVSPRRLSSGRGKGADSRVGCECGAGKGPFLLRELDGGRRQGPHGCGDSCWPCKRRLLITLYRIRTINRMKAQEAHTQARRSNGLARLAGTWSDEEHEQFEAAIAATEEIDDELWGPVSQRLSTTQGVGPHHD